MRGHNICFMEKQRKLSMLPFLNRRTVLYTLTVLLFPGFINDILSCILSQLQITDIIQVFYGSPAPLNRVREPLRQFVRTRVLEDAPPTIENIRQSVVRLIDSMQADIQDTVVCTVENYGWRDG